MCKTLSQIKEYARHKGLPLIPISGSDVSLLQEPLTFYETILAKTNSCTRRLAFSALYLGTDSKEVCIVNSICNNLIRNKNLDVIIALDANRSSRQDSFNRSSMTLLSKLFKYNTSVKINLINTSRNNFISRLIPLPKRWLELLSTYHAKLLVFDDDVILTGANLSSIYFEGRQDRYMLLKNCKHLSNYIFDLLHRLKTSDSSFKEAIERQNHHYVKQLANCDTQKLESESFIVPLVQCESEGLTEKEDFLCFLDSILPSNASVHLSSGYFNPSPRLSGLKINSVLAPSEEANGFFGGRGLLRYVPRLYSALHRHYLERHPSCELSYYNKPGWSFHGKGIWIEGLDNVYIHLIGSSNFNYRSAKRDFESQYVILTRDQSLIDKLKAERQALWLESKSIKSSYPLANSGMYNRLAAHLKSFL